MNAKRVFFLNSGRLVAQHLKGGRLTEQYSFNADEAGLAQFSKYLQATSAEPVSLLVDVVEEEFREETIPHVMGGDRSALLRNKRSRLFRDPTYSYAIVQGREAEGRRDDQVMFTALIRPDLLAPWVSQLARLKVPLTGIYSLPLLTERLLKPLKITSPNSLLVSIHSAGGLRQSFFEDGKLKLSRLAITPDVGVGRYPAYLLAEVEKLRRYLGSLRSLARDTPLDVYVLADGPVYERLEQQTADSVTTNFHLIRLSDASKRVGLKTLTPESSHADLLFSQLLIRSRPPNHYAPPRETKYFSLRKARTAMIAASVVALIASVGFAGFKFIEIVNTKQESIVVRKQTVFYNERLRLARAELPPAPANAREIQKAVEMVDAIQDYRATPFRMMTTLSDGLEAIPEIKIETIDWMVSADASATFRTRRSRNSQTTVNPDDLGSQYQIAHVRGRLEPFTGDYRQALDSVNRFAGVLQNAESVEEVKAISLPINTSSQQRLLGSTTGGVGSAEFELRVVLRTHAPQGES